MSDWLHNVSRNTISKKIANSLIVLDYEHHICFQFIKFKCILIMLSTVHKTKMYNDWSNKFVVYLPGERDNYIHISTTIRRTATFTSVHLFTLGHPHMKHT